MHQLRRIFAVAILGAVLHVRRGQRQQGQGAQGTDQRLLRRRGCEEGRRGASREGAREEAAAGAAKARVKPSSLASIDFDDDMFVGAGAGVPEPVMQTCDEDDRAAMESVLSTFGAPGKTATAPGEDDEVEEGEAAAVDPPRPSTLASMDLDDDEWMNADLSAKAAPEPVMQTCDEDDQAAMESVLSAIAGAEDDREEEVRRPATLASMDFDDDMLTGSAGEGGFEPVMQTCDEDDQAAMESVLFRFNARNEIESVEEKRKPSTLASIDFDDDMFVGSGDGAPEPVMQTCDEDDQAAMENVLSTFGAKKQDAADDGAATTRAKAADATSSPGVSPSSPRSRSRPPRPPRTSWTPAGTCPSRSSRPGPGRRIGPSGSTRLAIC